MVNVEYPMLKEKHVISFAAFLMINCALFGQDNSAKSYSVKFKGYKTHLTPKIRSTLDSVAHILKDQPVYYCAVTGCYREENERRNTADWDRVNNIVNYLGKQGVEQDRVYFTYGVGCNDHEFRITFTTQNSNTTPAPHPAIQRKTGRQCGN